MERRAPRFSAGVFAVALAALTPAFAGATSSNEAVRWNAVASDVLAAAQTDPLTESRILAILHLAIHDAVNAVEPRYAAYRFAAHVSGASADAAAAGAAHAVLVALVPNGKAQFDVELEYLLAHLPDDRAAAKGLEVGRKAAAAILAARRNDGADRPVVREAGTRPGEYRPTPPDFTPAAFAQWGSVTPFAVPSLDAFRPAPPPAVGSAVALADLREVKDVGALKGSSRVAEESEIAKYWYENSTQGWTRIARVIATDRGMDLHDGARLLAAVNVAMADGFIAGFEAKYRFYYWRPATAIRESGDPTWESFLWTPPVPDYPSTHTVLGASAAAAMRGVLGTDAVTFSMTSGAPYAGLVREFRSLAEAARENGRSRVLAGLHFTSAVEAGYAQGDRIGTHVAANLLRPLPSR
ncbi:MAG TPA: phosphatase PAP2 family protein [Candidatus Polarisedimenticolaceae bacterium]